jgi:hypothetical protein
VNEGTTRHFIHEPRAARGKLKDLADILGKVPDSPLPIKNQKFKIIIHQSIPSPRHIVPDSPPAPGDELE